MSTSQIKAEMDEISQSLRKENSSDSPNWSVIDELEARMSTLSYLYQTSR